MCALLLLLQAAVSYCNSPQHSPFDSPLCNVTVFGLPANEDNYYFVAFLNVNGAPAWTSYKDGNGDIVVWPGQARVGQNPQDKQIKALYKVNSSYAMDFYALPQP